MQLWSLGWEDPLKEGMAVHFRILAWKIPWTEEPGGLQSIGLQKVGHDWVTEHACVFLSEAPILGPPDVKSRLIRKDFDAGKGWRQEKGTTEDEMVWWHHWLDGHEFEQALGDGEGQRSLANYSPWGRKESDDLATGNKLCGIDSVYNLLLRLRTNELTFKQHLLCSHQEKKNISLSVIAEIRSGSQKQALENDRK